MKQKVWKICVCGVIKYLDKYLILKRTNDDDDMPDTWEFPSGNAICGENLTTALIREIKEETDIDVNESTIKLCSFSQYESEKADYIKCSVQLNFLIDFKTQPRVTISTEHVDYKWVTKDNPHIDKFLSDIITAVNF